MRSVPAGGAATINGIAYQMLWSLFRATAIRISDCRQSPHDDSLAEATLVLEPAGGGGDIRAEHAAGVVVEQVKARPNKGTWSLTEIVESVLPDLVRAVDPNDPHRAYRFITEGRMGNWRQVYDFFQSLRNRGCPEHNILEGLDDSAELPFQRRRRGSRGSTAEDPWTERRYTERTLFDGIVRYLLHRSGREAAVSEDSMRRKLWHLLGRFEFVPERTATRLEEEIDRRLLDFVDLREQIPEKRRAMLQALAEQAAKGNARISSEAFFADHLLDSKALSNWQELLRSGRQRFMIECRLRGYDAGHDVRGVRQRGTIGEWRDRSPILVIGGESGQGKSWFLFGVGVHLVEHGELCILVPATGGAEDTIQRAANVFWQTIKGNDGQLSLERIAARRREVVQRYADRWLTLLIDGVQDYSEARELAVQPWEEWGVRVAISCTSDVAGTIEARGGDRSVPLRTGDFTEEELSRYLSKHFGEAWPSIPRDVRDTLRRPLLATLYASLASGSAWHPTSEYELYSRYWSRLREDEREAFPLDAVGLRRAAFSVLKGGAYPWSAEQLGSAGLDNDAITRLRRRGVLRATGTGGFELWHDRLLNWAVAESLTVALESGAIDQEKLCEQLGEIFGERKTYSGRALGYVPMDVVWLLANQGAPKRELLGAILAALEETPWPNPEHLYRDLLPTIGASIAPAMLDRLAVVADSDDVVRLGSMVDGIASLGTEVVGHPARSLLDHDSPFVQRAGMRLLAVCPSKDALDRLWTLHCAIAATPASFQREKEGRYGPYKDSITALRSCVALDPPWLERAIGRSKPDQEPVESLAWLLAGLDDSDEFWLRCKRALFEKVSQAKERCLAANIYAHRDETEVDWLISRVERADGLVGAMATRALIRVAPDRALEQIARMPVRDLGPTRHWCFSELLAKRPEAARAKLLARLREATDAWQVALVYQNNEDAMDAATLDFLLDQLEGLLDRQLAAPTDGSTAHPYVPLKMLANIHRMELLDCFACRAGTPLERKLTKWLLTMGPRRSDGHDRLEREPSMQIVYKIGGNGFTQVVNDWLKADNRHGRFDGVHRAAKRADAQTVALLVQMTRREELWDGDHPAEQGWATEALAALGEWQHVIDSILRWGLRTHRRVFSYRQRGTPLNDTLLRAPLDALAAQGDVAGAVLALAVTSRKDVLDRIHEVANSASPESQVMLACIQAVADLDDRSPRAEELFVRQLDVPNHRHDAAAGLLRIGTPSALDALVTRIAERYDDLIVPNLLRRSQTRVVAARSVWEELHRLPRSGLADTHISSLGWLPDPEARDYLRRIAFDTDRASPWVDHRARAIRGLSRFDPASAFLAAREALKDRTGRDRATYPALLWELNRDEAVPILLAHLVGETDAAVIEAIGRMLEDVDLGSRLDDWFASSDEAHRIAACRLAAWREPTKAILTVLRTRLDDVSEPVTDAARKALARLQRHVEANQVVSAIRTAASDSRKWILLDALIEIADPGSRQAPWPHWAQEVMESLPLSMRPYLADALRKRQDEDARRHKKATP